MFLLLPRTCVSSTISTSSTTSKSSALLTKELNYLTLYKQFIEECDLEEIPYLRLASGLQPGTKDFFAKELSWYKYIADLMNRKHLSLNTSEINQEQAELSIKDFIDLKKKQKKQNTPHFIAIPNDQEYYNSKIKSLNNLEIQEEYIKKYNQRDVLSPPPFIEYHDFSSTGLCTFGEFDEGCIALEARNNTTDPFGINDIQHWRQLDRIKEIYNLQSHRWMVKR
ncbi:hypothetical protein Bealeia1_01979 (plasmid) [Candidatus Bealeia paramacronuclearis]|uniref:Uncharacterized protein n=1 Tax=Candidatus Bealeia paramacronuclearis TaxID=1921001 RepID=A0ABZ2C8C2_9PROT